MSNGQFNQSLTWIWLCFCTYHFVLANLYPLCVAHLAPSSPPPGWRWRWPVAVWRWFPQGCLKYILSFIIQVFRMYNISPKSKVFWQYLLYNYKILLSNLGHGGMTFILLGPWSESSLLLGKSSWLLPVFSHPRTVTDWIYVAIGGLEWVRASFAPAALSWRQRSRRWKGNQKSLG